MNTKLIVSFVAACTLALPAASCKRAEKKSATASKPSGGSGSAGSAAPAPVPSSVGSAHGNMPPGHPGMSGMSGHGSMGMSGGGGGIVAGTTAEDGTKTMGPLQLVVPKAWKESPPSSSMRLAQFTVTGAGGPAELVVYYFGGGGGSVEANLDRWYGQFQQPDGSSSKDKAKREDREVGGFKVTAVDVAGRYVAAVRPGATEKHDTPNSEMLAAIVQTEKGPIFFKMVGPEKTVSAAKKDWQAMIGSFTKAPAGSQPAASAPAAGGW